MTRDHKTNRQTPASNSTSFLHTLNFTTTCTIAPCTITSILLIPNIKTLKLYNNKWHRSQPSVLLSTIGCWMIGSLQAREHSFELLNWTNFPSLPSLCCTGGNAEIKTLHCDKSQLKFLTVFIIILIPIQYSALVQRI